jgi:iron complex transport system substrate-binding protein
MTAVRRSWLYALNGDNISRQGPRVVDGAAAVCAVLDQVRSERAAR